MTSSAADSPRTRAATSFLRMVSAGDVDRAFSAYTAENFRHHNPYFPGDAASLARAMAENAAQFPGKALTVERTVEQGDLVAVHSRVRHAPDQPEYALAHIFRFEGERVAELWDLAMQVPDDSPNQYGMF